MPTVENTKALSKRNRRARRNLVLKLSLEAKFTPEVTSYFNKIIKLTVNTFLEDRLMLDSSIFFPATRQLLSKQYKRVARAFVDDMRLFISKSDGIQMETKQDEEEIESAVATALSIFLVPTVQKRANVLDKTTEKDIKAAFSEVQAQAIEEGIDLTEATFITLISKRLRDKFRARTPLISLTETQFSAESTKQIEAAVLSSGGDPRVVDPVTGEVTQGETLTFSKEWAAILDQKTRAAHVQADGQTVPAKGEFIVGGDFLRFPGDSGLGAKKSNTINCRCASLFSPVSSGPVRFRN